MSPLVINFILFMIFMHLDDNYQKASNIEFPSLFFVELTYIFNIFHTKF